LRKVTSSTEDLTRLNQAATSYLYLCVQRETITSSSLQLKSDPMILALAFRAQDHWLPFQVFDHDIDVSIVEQITKRTSTADLRNLDRRPNKVADVFESAIALVQE